MKEYRMEFECNNGFCSEVVVYAANRLAAFMEFEELGFDGVINVECYLVEV